MVVIALVSCATPQYSIVKPNSFTLGASFQEIKSKAIGECESIKQRNIVPITSPLAKESQKQIDCFGYMYAGKPRKVELVFLDNQLDLIWILISESEKNEVIYHMSKYYGEPSMVIDFGTVYLQENSAVRNVPPEVLFASQRQVQVMLKSLAK